MFSSFRFEEQSVFVIICEAGLVGTVLILLFLCYHGGFTIRMPCGSLKCLCENTRSREARRFGLALGVRDSQTATAQDSDLPDMVTEILGDREMEAQTPGGEEEEEGAVASPDVEEGEEEEGVLLMERAAADPTLLSEVRERLGWVLDALNTRRLAAQFDTELLLRHLQGTREDILAALEAQDSR